MSAEPLRDPCPADRRRVASPSGTVALEHARREIRRANEHDVLLGKLLAQVERDRSYVAEGCSSALHWAQMNGLDKGRAASLLGAGRSFEVVPEAERAVLDGEVTPQAAGVVGRLIPATPMLPPAAPVDPQQQAAQDAARDEALADRARTFFDHAKTTPTHKLVRDVNAENERLKQGERVVPLHFEVKEQVRDGWRLAKKIACRRANRALTEGEAFALVTDDYLSRHDKDNLSGRKQPRERRMGPTSERPDHRTIASEVRREVRARSEGHCEFPGCSNGMFLQLCHIVAHRDRGDREAANFVDLCTQHHTMLDKGLIRFFARTEIGVSFVLTRTGEVIEPDSRRHNADVLPGAPVVGGERGESPNAAADADAQAMEQRGPGGAGLDGAGPGRAGLGRAGLGCAGLGRAGLGRAGLGRAGLAPGAGSTPGAGSKPDELQQAHGEAGSRDWGTGDRGTRHGDEDTGDWNTGDGSAGDWVAERPPPWGGGWRGSAAMHARRASFALETASAITSLAGLIVVRPARRVGGPSAGGLVLGA